MDPASVDRLLRPVIEALLAEGLDAIVTRSGPGFARLSVTKGEERTELDLAADARLLPLEQGPTGRTLAGEELAVDKALAVVGRALPRDFIDLAALEPRYGLEHLFDLAAEKDPGFDARVFAEMARRIDRFRSDAFPVAPGGRDDLLEAVADWSAQAMSYDRERCRDRNGPDLGMDL